MDKLLSCEELFQASAEKCVKPLYEPKKNLNSSSQGPESDVYLEGKYLEMEGLLSQQRIVKQKSSIGEYCEGKVVLKRKAGNWNKFGYTEQRVDYVPLHEALFLVEMKRLIVFRNTVVMSVEECYQTFLASNEGGGLTDRLTLPEYLVYAQMTRNGFYVPLHRKTPKTEAVSEEDLIWTHLKDLLANTNRSGSNSSMRDGVVKSMEHHRNFIASQSKTDTLVDDQEMTCAEFEWPKKPQKRKRTPEWDVVQAKRSKWRHQESPLNALKSDPEYQQMKSCFEGLEVIQISSLPIETDFKPAFQFRFDILNPQPSYKRDCVPHYRGIVCMLDNAPSYKDLVYLQRQQTPAVPILIFHVDEAFIVNCFLYEVDG